MIYFIHHLTILNIKFLFKDILDLVLDQGCPSVTFSQNFANRLSKNANAYLQISQEILINDNNNLKCPNKIVVLNICFYSDIRACRVS